MAGTAPRSVPACRRVAIACALVLAALVAALPPGTAAEQASQPSSAQAGQLDAGRNHSCAVVQGAGVRCWGFGREGELGTASRDTVGDNETPAAVPPVNLGDGRSAAAISAGDFHTCVVLEDVNDVDDGRVRCWGFAGNGRLGYGNEVNVGDTETPGSVGPVDLGAGRTAKAITAGGGHTCALLDDDSVRCWGYAFFGQLGYATLGADNRQENIGDNESPGSVGPVSLGGPAVAVTAGDLHTCALLGDGSVRCWGAGDNGQLGYGNTNEVGDDELPVSVGPVDLGQDRKAVAISAGTAQTCALLDDGNVRCWGYGGNGRLGYGNGATIGDDETPGSVGPVNLGAGRRAVAVSVGDGHACALLDDGNVRCWGFAIAGQLGYANTRDIGDNEVPGAVGPVNLGAGRTAVAISAGSRHTCARLDDGNVRCWGYGGNGRLGYCNERNVGDNETPGSVGPVALGAPGGGGAECVLPGPGTAAGGPPGSGAFPLDPLAAEAARRRGLRSCLARVTRHARREIRRARRLSGRRRAVLRRHARRHRSRLRRRCLERWGRTPGRVTGLEARAVSRRAVRLTFNAAGTDGRRPPAARTYLVKQSRRPIRGARAFRRAQTLCRGRCRFPRITAVGTPVRLDVEDLRPRTTYYYAVAARDNVSGRVGLRSRAVRVRTR